MSKENFEKPWPADRLEFEKANPQVEVKSGRVLWRIAEIDGQLAKVSERLKATDLSKEERYELQGRWLVLAGVLAHYVGDISQPLHVTENYDGKKTNQDGIHSFFEETLVNELYPRLDDFVHQETIRIWPQRRKQLSKSTSFELAKELAEDSLSMVPQLLAIDKKVGRKNLAHSVRSNKSLIVKRMAQGSIYLAEMLRRHMDWKFEGDKFFYFDPSPSFIEPPGNEKGFFKSLIEDSE
jgi:hypothetical protein